MASGGRVARRAGGGRVQETAAPLPRTLATRSHIQATRNERRAARRLLTAGRLLTALVRVRWTRAQHVQQRAGRSTASNGLPVCAALWQRAAHSAAQGATVARSAADGGQDQRTHA